MEVADAVSGCEVLRLAGRASQRRAQDRIHARRHPAEPIGERAIAVVREDGCGRGAAHDAVVACDFETQAEARAHEREPVADCQRQAEGIRLDAPSGDDLSIQLDGREHAGDVDGLDARLAQQAVARGARPREHVRAEVQPVVAAAIGADPAADAVRRLEDDDVQVAERPRRRQPGDPAADDHDVRH